MRNELLVTLVNSILGEGKPTSRGNVAYVCPFHKSSSNSKKLEINFNEDSPHYSFWGCWVCRDKAKGKNLLNLFRRVKANETQIEELKSIMKDRLPSSYYSKNEELVKELELPKEFTPFFEVKGIMARRVGNFLKSRGLTREDIIKYNIGYCNSGPYSERIIIPSYNSEGKLNYFTARTINPVNSYRYMNPPTPRDIIMFESFINWDLPIILCEGPLDAIAIKRNVIPLMGNDPQKSLLKKIISSKVQKVYLALDEDMFKKSLRFAQDLLDKGKKVYLIKLGEKDPSDIGFKEFTKIAQTTTPLDSFSIMKEKLSLI